MKIGVLGSGDVAKALAGGFIKHGHDLMVGTRDPSKLADWTAQQRNAKVGGFADAAKFGEVVVLAVKGSVAAEALRAAGSANLSGKVVIDATNPIADAPPVNGVLKFFTLAYPGLPAQRVVACVQTAALGMIDPRRVHGHTGVTRTEAKRPLPAAIAASASKSAASWLNAARRWS
jgi:predicted dinucleotide-binding enzyme